MGIHDSDYLASEKIPVLDKRDRTCDSPPFTGQRSICQRAGTRELFVAEWDCGKRIAQVFLGGQVTLGAPRPADRWLGDLLLFRDLGGLGRLGLLGNRLPDLLLTLFEAFLEPGDGLPEG